MTTTPLTGWYQAAKHAIEALSDALRMEVAHDGIKIVLVEPGGVKTGIWDMAETDMQGRAGSRYRTSYERSLGGIRLSQPFMADPNAVARVIARALGARSPRPRYLVGLDAQVASAVDKLVPTPVKDRFSRLAIDL